MALHWHFLKHIALKPNCREGFRCIRYSQSWKFLVVIQLYGSSSTQLNSCKWLCVINLFSMSDSFWPERILLIWNKLKAVVTFLSHHFWFHLLWMRMIRGLEKMPGSKGQMNQSVRNIQIISYQNISSCDFSALNIFANTSCDCDYRCCKADNITNLLTYSRLIHWGKG